MAADAKTGNPLWGFQTNHTWRASPMAYMFDGKQVRSGRCGIEYHRFWQFRNRRPVRSISPGKCYASLRARDCYLCSRDATCDRRHPLTFPEGWSGLICRLPSVNAGCTNASAKARAIGHGTNLIIVVFLQVVRRGRNIN